MASAAAPPSYIQKSNKICKFGVKCPDKNNCSYLHLTLYKVNSSISDLITTDLNLATATAGRDYRLISNNIIILAQNHLETKKARLKTLFSTYDDYINCINFDVYVVGYEDGVIYEHNDGIYIGAQPVIVFSAKNAYSETFKLLNLL